MVLVFLGLVSASGMLGCALGAGEKTVSENTEPRASLISQSHARENGAADALSPDAVKRTAASPERRYPSRRLVQVQPEAEPESEATPTSEVDSPPVPAESKRVPVPTVTRAGMVSLNFNRADLIEVIHILAQHLRLTYTIDPEVKGTVTIHSSEPLRKDDLMPILNQVLRMNGAVAIRTGEIYRIVPIKDGKALARPVGPNRDDSFAIQVVPVRFFSVAEMKRLLTPFLTPGGEVLEYPRGNFLLVVDLSSNIRRLVEIRDLIDVQVFAGTLMEIYQPKVASAEELASEMTKIMQSYASSAAQAEGFAAQFIPLPRINQLLVISHSEGAWTYVKRWLERIDVVAEGPGRRIFIYPVENGKATELADVLNQALGQASTGRRETSPTLQDLHRASPAGTSQFGTPRSSSSSFGAPSMRGGQQTITQPSSAFATVPAPGQPPAPAAPPATRTPPPTPAAKPQEKMRIVADPATNSLIIYGTAQEFQNIQNILKDLDVIPRQVLMDVLVAEVTLSDDLSFGIEYEIFRRTGVSIFGDTFGSQGGVRSGILSSSVVRPDDQAAGVLTQFGRGISGVAGRSNAVRAFINALMSDSRVRVLSSPSVLATDNRPARIQVGTEEPVPTGTLTQTVGTIAESTSIQYRNTGRIVTIIPQVNSQGLVNLQILAEVSQRGGDVTVGPNTFPAFDIRQAETTAVVQDGETLVIGGIISERKSRSRAGIPFLMDIPVLGRFFGATFDEVDRTELVMLITPHVIRNKEESRSVSEDFKNKLSTVRSELERLEREREKEKAGQRKNMTPQKPPEFVPQTDSKIGGEEKKTAAPVEQKAASVTPIVQKKPAAIVPQLDSKAGVEEKETVAPMEQMEQKATPATPIIQENPPPTQPTVEKPSEPPAKKNEGEVRPKPQLPLQEVKAEGKGDPRRTIAKLEASREAEAQAHKVRYALKSETEDGTREKVWAVQVKSDRDEDVSSNLMKRLIEQGYDAYILRAVVSGQTWYRVRVGHFTEEEQARKLRELLKSKQGFEEAFTVVR